jgi:hypothetical protein
MRVLLFLVCWLSVQAGMAQGEITSSHGWTATVEITPVNVVPHTLNCPWFYHYNVEFDYQINFSGAEANRRFSAQVYFQCDGGTGGEPFAPLVNNAQEMSMGTKTTLNNARQIYANGEAYNYGNRPSCEEVELYDVGCTMVRMFYWGKGVQTGSITFNTGSGPLPIELYDFTVRAEPYGIVLEWTTLSELNNDFFLIEKSTNGEDWRVVNTVNGAGTTATTNSYSLIDSEIDAVTYYRLSQIDFDGQRETFNPVVVAPENHKRLQEPYPNPASNFLFIPGLGDREVIQILGLDGRVITEHEYVRDGESIDVRNMPEGIYLIEIHDENYNGSLKVVVEH